MSGRINHRKDTGAYYVVWWDPVEKKQVKIYRYKGEKIFHRKTAEKLLAQMQGDVENGTFYLEKYTGKYWTDVLPFLDDWFDAVKHDLTPATAKGYRSYLKNHLKPFFQKNNVMLHEIQLDVLTRLLNSLKPVGGEGELSGKQKFNIMSCFHACLDYAWRSRRIMSIPPFPRKSAYQMQESVIRWLPEDRQMKILEAIPEEHQPFFYFLKYHMRRPAEAMALYKEDYNDGVFYIRRSISARQLIHKTKTGAVHVIPMHDDFAPYLARAMKAPVISPFMFTCSTSRSEGKRYSDGIIQRIWKDACEKAGEDIDLYSGLKHSTVTQYAVDKGYSDSELQMLTDHARIDSIKRYRKLEVASRKRLLMGKKVIPFEDKKRKGPKQ